MSDDDSYSDNLQITSDDEFGSSTKYLNDFGYFHPENVDDLVSSTPTKKNHDMKNNVQSSDAEISNVLLNSMALLNQVDTDESKKTTLRVECQLWTTGFDRSFKVCNLELWWVLNI